MKWINLLLLVYVSTCGAASETNTAPDWTSVVAAYMEFSSNVYPTSRTGEAQGAKLLGLMPKTGSCNGRDSAIPALMVNSEYFQDLSKIAYSGNSQAAEVMFRLSALLCGDAADSELVDISIGKLIKPQPRLFLALVDKYGVTDLSGILGNLGDEFVDEPDKSAEELQRRYDALASVKEVSNETKQKCLDELKKQIAQEKQS